MSDEPKTIDLPTSTADFELLFKSVTVKDATGDEKPAVRVTASSTSIDLATDRFAKSALVQMAAQFPQMTIFLNHKYNVPEDVFGKVSSAELVERDGYTDLDLEVDVSSNARAIETYAMIKDGTVLGVSIGVLVLDADYVEDEKTKGAKILEITSVHTLEASVVGIPANRRSWVQGAIKAASALAGKVINKKADGTSLVALKSGEVIEVTAMAEENETPEAIAAAAEPPEITASPEAKAVEPAAPAAPADVTAAAKPAADDDDMEDDGKGGKKPKDKAAKPAEEPDADDEEDDGKGGKKPKGKAAAVEPDTTKGTSMTGRAAARGLCDDMYGVVWTLWDAIYEAFCDDGMEVEAKRGQAKSLLAEFSTLCMRMVDNVIEEYWGSDDADTEEQKAAKVEAAKAFVEAMAAYSVVAKDVKTGGSLKLAGISPEDVSRLSHQSSIVIDKNRELAGELATKDAAHAIAITEKDGIIHGLYECVDMLMEMPVARKTADTPQQDDGMAALEERFPQLDKRILSNFAELRTKRMQQKNK